MLPPSSHFSRFRIAAGTSVVTRIPIHRAAETSATMKPSQTRTAAMLETTTMTTAIAATERKNAAM